MLFKKGSKEAKDYMARLRACKVSGTQTKKAKPKKKSEFPIKPTTPKKRVVKQTGTSDTYLDKLRKALPPGKRTSSSGVEYYEYRKNRTDAKGKLTGTDYDNNYMYEFLSDLHKDLEYSSNQILIYQNRLNYYKTVFKEENKFMSITFKKELNKNITKVVKYIEEMKQHVKEIKKLL